jgi:hypothetical protein
LREAFSPQGLRSEQGFSWFFELVVFVDVRAGNERLFEQAVNLAQFPEDQNEENRDYKQQELNIHFHRSLATEELLMPTHSTTRFAP